MTTTIVAEPKKRRLPRHPRLRDWPIRTWAFSCEIVGDLPAWVGSTKELQRRLWNDMAFELKRQLAPHKILGDDPNDVVKAKQEARHAIAKQFKDTKHLRAFGQQYRGQMTSDCYYAVVDRFLLGMREWPARRQRAKTAKGYAAWESGLPSPKYHNQEFDLNLPVAFNAIMGQETTWAELYGEGGNVSLYRLPEAALGRRHNTEFRLKTPQGTDGKLAYLKLLAKIHRLPPPHAIVKRVTLTCKSEKGFRDRYEIQFSLEMPLLDLPRKMTGRVAGYDSGGWRVFYAGPENGSGHVDRVRVGVIGDNAGHFYEIAVPFDFTSREDRKRVEPKSKDIRRLILLSEQIGDCVENCKRALLPLYECNKASWTEEARTTMKGFTKMRQGGLARLREKLGGADAESDDLLSKLALILDWLHHKKRALELEWASLKEETYKQIAAWIAGSFDIVAWEGDLSLKRMAEAGAGDPSQRYRQMVGQYYLRERIRQAASKFRCDLRDHRAAYSSQTCAACCGTIEKSRNLLRVCENGHKQDRDVNASSVLLSEIEEATSISAPPVEIPRHLRRYVRVMAASEAAIEVEESQ